MKFKQHTSDINKKFKKTDNLMRSVTHTTYEHSKEDYKNSKLGEYFLTLTLLDSQPQPKHIAVNYRPHKTLPYASEPAAHIHEETPPIQHIH